MGEMPLSELTEHVKGNIDKDQQQNMADLLTELLVLYGNGPEHIRPSVMYMCEGIAKILPDELVNKSEDYAMYRLQKTAGATDLD